MDNYTKKEVPGENGTQGMDAQFQTMKMDDQYLRPLSLTSLSSAISTFNKLRKDIVDGYCSLLASISFNSNCISYTCKRNVFITF